MRKPTSSQWGRVLLAVVLLGVVTAGAAAVQSTDGAPTAVSECTTISESGTYVMEGNTTYTGTVGSTACITIVADDVVLDGQGATFDGRGISNVTGIRVAGAENVTVRNIHVQDWHRGVDVVDGSGTRVRGVTASESVYGVSVERSTDTVVRDSRASRTMVGVRIADSTGTTITNVSYHRVSGRDVYRP